jgi:hypothetical protein
VAVGVEKAKIAEATEFWYNWLWTCHLRATFLKHVWAYSGKTYVVKTGGEQQGLYLRNLFEHGENRSRIIVFDRLPTNKTAFSAFANTHAISTTIFSFGLPGGPDISRIRPVLRPPSRTASRPEHRVLIWSGCSNMIDTGWLMERVGKQVFWQWLMTSSACCKVISRSTYCWEDEEDEAKYGTFGKRIRVRRAQILHSFVALACQGC